MTARLLPWPRGGVRGAWAGLLSAAVWASALATPARADDEVNRPNPVATAAPAASAVAAAPERLQADVREAVLRVPAQVNDAFGKVIEGELVVTTFRPPGPGPFPLVIISHGRNAETRADYKRQRFESAARFFVRKGFAVAVPLRLGYGELAGAGDPEDSIACDRPRFGPALAAAATQILLVRDAMAQQPDIDTQRLVLVGQSVGGISTIAATAVHVPGQVAAINFAGGHGGNPDKHPRDPCQTEQLRQLYRAYGQANARVAPPTPTLWVYTENDRYFGPRHAKRWAAAYADAGGQVDLRLLPPFGEDGHKLFGSGNDLWQPLVDEFLKPLGFSTPGHVPPPAPVQPLDGEASVPPGARPDAVTAFQKFLAAKTPRAFAIDGQGHWGYASGDDVLSRALALCHRNIKTDGEGRPATTCRLYAHNDALVAPPAP